MARRSAGLLLYRIERGTLKVLLAHPGGPFWARRDLGVWSIPKGEVDPGEDPRRAALREFAEETGTRLPGDGPLIELGETVQKGGKVVTAWAMGGDLDPATICSNLIEIAWPPRSGRRLSVPEIDRVAWFDLSEAREKILEAQIVFLDRLQSWLRSPPGQDITNM